MKTSPKTQTVSAAPARFGFSPVAAGCAMLVLATSGVYAQSTAPAAPAAAPATLDTVTVTGIRRGIEAAIAVKKDSTSIVEAVSAEDIGKLTIRGISSAVSCG